MPFETELEVEFIDGEDWLLTKPLAYLDIKETERPISVVVPEGFITDFASIPRALWSLYPPTGLYAPAAVVHDYIYRNGLFSRGTADAIFLHAMEDLKVRRTARWTIYLAVRAFGWTAYKD